MRAAFAVILLIGSAERPPVTWAFTANVAAAPVADTAGVAIPQAFLGGFDVPRPQLVDINGDGKPVLFVQEHPDEIMQFEQVDGHWLLRSEKYQNLDVGEWFRFVDIDGDGRIDLFAEMPTGYIRIYRNVGTRTAARFVALGDTIRDTDNQPIIADRQNILNAVDIDCNGKLDLFIGRVQGTVDRFEQDVTGPDGAPRFRLIAPNWEGIEILGPEATAGTPSGTITRDTVLPHGSSRHGANTLTFADVSGRGILDLYWGDFFEPGLLQITNVGTCQRPNLQTKPVEFPIAHPVLTSGYNAATFGDVDGDGNLDLVMGVIGGAYGPSSTAIDNLYYLRQAPKGVWHTVTSRLIPTIDVGSEAIPALGDLRGTGRLDLLVGNKLVPGTDTTAAIEWFENVGTATRPAFRDRGALPIHGEFNYAPAIADLDGDGLPDLIVGTWRDRVEWYRNTGTRTQPKWTLADSALVTIPRGSYTAPTLADLDGDGLLDMIIGTAGGRLLLYRNVGSRTMPKFQLVTASFQDIHFGRRATPVLADVDGDGRPDLLVGSENGEVRLWRNAGTNPGEIRLVEDTTFKLQGQPLSAPAVGDLRGAGKPDILLGTGAGGIRWYENHSVVH